VRSRCWRDIFLHEELQRSIQWLLSGQIKTGMPVLLCVIRVYADRPSGPYDHLTPNRHARIEQCWGEILHSPSSGSVTAYLSITT
jgi:hypothetical protein